MVYVLHSSNEVEILFGNGDGTFPLPSLRLSVNAPSGLHAVLPTRVDVGDLNDDGLKDIVVAARESGVGHTDASGRISVILGKYGAPE